MKAWSISGSTSVVGLIGDPVAHSVSPAMQNAAFRALGLDFIYIPFRVKKDDLPHAVNAVRALNMRGINVTVPHKVDIMPLLDELTPLACEIGSVNAVVNDDGRLKGFNTDAEGFVYSLFEHEIEPEGKNVVMLGAGGAARSIAFALASRGANLIILNRTPARAAKCAADITAATGQTVEVLTMDARNLADAMEKGDIVVNATSVGMHPNKNETLLDAKLIRSSMVVVDIVYNPPRTRLLAEAEKAGAMTINGMEMLVRQGAMAFEKWTGRTAPLAIMRKEAAQAVKHYEK